MIDEDELEAHARATQQAAWSYNFHRQDKCPRCAHLWHGVACKAPTGTTTPCPCETAWEEVA